MTSPPYHPSILVFPLGNIVRNGFLTIVGLLDWCLGSQGNEIANLCHQYASFFRSQYYLAVFHQCFWSQSPGLEKQVDSSTRLPRDFCTKSYQTMVFGTSVEQHSQSVFDYRLKQKLNTYEARKCIGALTGAIIFQKPQTASMRPLTSLPASKNPYLFEKLRLPITSKE